MEERGYVVQQCTTCRSVCSGSTINRSAAETYDPRCYSCGTDTMRIIEWVSLSTGG